jgi:hypothetical protein
MLEKNYLHRDTNEYSPEPGQFIEFSATLTKNPIIEVLGSMKELMTIGSTFLEPASQKPQKNQEADTKPQVDVKAISKQMDSFPKLINTGKMSDLISAQLKFSFKCVVTLENQFLNDAGMFDHVDGTFTVTGKVIRSVREDGAVNLFRNSPHAMFPKKTFDQLAVALQALTDNHAFKLPPLDVEVSAPVIQVLPICIFA